jgi:uncharacterized protein
VRCFRAAGLLTLLWLALLPASGRAEELVPLPTLKARVTDLTASLDATQRGRLEAQLAAFDRAGRAQIAVLMLPTTRPETIEQFGIRLAEAWKIGHKDADNGIIVIVAKDDRKMRIEVGYGLEGSIPDAIAKRIIVERMAPKFKQGDFFGGLFATTEALDQAISGPASGAASAGDAVPTAPVEMAGYNSGNHPDWISWLFGTVVAAGLLRHLFGLFGSLACGRRRRLARLHGFRFDRLRHRRGGADLPAFLRQHVFRRRQRRLSGGGGLPAVAAAFRVAAAASAAAALRGAW